MLRDLAPARCRFRSTQILPRSTGRCEEPPAAPCARKRTRLSMYLRDAALPVLHREEEPPLPPLHQEQDGLFVLDLLDPCVELPGILDGHPVDRPDDVPIAGARHPPPGSPVHP